MKKYKMILLAVLANVSYVLATPGNHVFKNFDIQSAIISYDINGSGKLSEESNLSIKGRSTLLFTEWGARKLYKEKYVETLTGAVKNTRTIRTLYREDRGVIYRADFEKNKIEKSDDAVIKNAIKTGQNLYQKSIEEMMANGKQLEASSVLGYRCDEWLYKGKKRCFYNGIPLREESIISGVKVVKTAVSVQFDVNISEDSFALPDFKQDKQKGFLLESNKATLEKNKPKPDQVSDKNTSYEEEAFVKVEEKEIDDGGSLAKNVFEEQKTLLPKLLREMQEARVCLENADDKNSANTCLAKLVEIEEKMSGEKNKEDKIALWTDTIREKTMDELEEGILDLKRRMPCIRRSRNFEDLSACMQAKK